MIYTSRLENHTTLLTNMKDLGLYLWDRLCTDACSKRLCIENQQNPNYKPEFCGYFLHVTVRQALSSINIFFLKDCVRLKQTLYKCSELPSLYKKQKYSCCSFLLSSTLKPTLSVTVRQNPQNLSLHLNS